MTGYPEFNFPAFYAAEDYLREVLGFNIVYNPARKEDEKKLDKTAYDTGDAALAIEKGFDFLKVYLWDVEKVIAADAIYMLIGWEQSAGAKGELAVAQAVQRHYPNDYEILFQNEWHFSCMEAS